MVAIAIWPIPKICFKKPQSLNLVHGKIRRTDPHFVRCGPKGNPTHQEMARSFKEWENATMLKSKRLLQTLFFIMATLLSGLWQLKLT